MPDNALGAWSNDRAALENAPLTGRGSDADAPDLLRFSRAITQLVVRREEHPDCEYDRPAAFVLAPREFSRPSASKRRPLLHTGQYPLTGQVHFVNLTGNGHSLAYDGDEGDLFDAISAAGAERYPTLLYVPKCGFSTLSYFPDGTAAEESTGEPWSVSGAQADVSTILSTIDAVYEGDLKTPDGTEDAIALWKNASKGWADQHAERHVQFRVKLGLLGAFRTLHVRAEQADKDGRTDLEIVDLRGKANSVSHHAVLELKVLREFGSTGRARSDKEVADHMSDGLAQADQYGRQRNFKHKLLCCFDMRAKNQGPTAAYAALQDDADKLGVALGYWFLYRSSDEWRHCGVAKALAAQTAHGT